MPPSSCARIWQWYIQRVRALEKFSKRMTNFTVWPRPAFTESLKPISFSFMSQKLDERLGRPLRGWYFVVLTVNFRSEQSSARSVVISGGFELEHCYTLVGSWAINYSFIALKRSRFWRANLDENSAEQRMLLFACHEGNCPCARKLEAVSS